MIAAASCGGGESSGSGGSDNAVGTSSSETQGDGSLQAANTGGSTADGEPISGPVVSLLSPELGLYAIDRVTNEVRNLEMDGVEFTNRQIQPILVGDSVYMLTATTLDGQFSSHEIGVGKVDLASGNGVELLRLGTDRETDEDPDLITFELVGGDASTIWVTRGPFADPENLTYLGIDASTGDGTGQFEVVPYEETTENGSSCGGGFREAIVLEDGTMVGLTSGWPSSVDTTTGEVEPLVNLCDFDAQIDLGSLISPAELNDYVVTETGSPIPDDQAERALGVIEPQVSNGTFVAGDASLWWIFSTGTGYDEGGESLSAHAGGIVQFDLATNSIVNVWPLGSDTVTYEDSDDDITRVSTLSQADLRYLDGKLWIMDSRENAPLRVLDPSTGELTVITIEKSDGVDFTTANLISSDPESIWLDVSRSTITSEEGELQSSLGINFLDQFDPASDAFTSSIKSLTIIGF
jgi:hypothetical protein